MTRTIPALLIISLIPLWASTATAAPAVPVRRVRLQTANAVITVKVYPEFQSVFQFPERVVAASVGNRHAYVPEVDGDTVLLNARSGSMPSSLFVKTHTLRVTLLLEIATSMESAEPMLVFERPSETAPVEREPQLEGVQKSDAEHAHRADEHVLRFASSLSRANQRAKQTWRNGDDAMSLEVTVLAFGATQGLVRFAATNLGVRPFPLEQVELVDADDLNYSLKSWREGRSSHGVAGEVQPGQTIAIAALFRDPESLEDSMRIKLVPSAGASAVYAMVGKVYSDVPNQGRHTVLLWGGGGGLQLSSGDDSALVGAWGGGAHYLYGVGARWSVGIGFSRLASGEAELAGVTQSESFYRVHGGLRHLFREEGWIPFGRIGVGGALVSVAEGDDSSFQARGFFQAGAGITHYLGDALVIGAEALAEFPLGAGEVTFLANAHIGFAWGGYDVQ